MAWNVSVDNQVHVNIGSPAAAPASTGPAHWPAHPPVTSTSMSHHHVYEPVTAGAVNPWCRKRSTPDQSSHPPSCVPTQLAYPVFYPAVLLASPAPMHYPGQPRVQIYTAQPTAPVPTTINHRQGTHAQYAQGGNNVHTWQPSTGQAPQGQSHKGPLQLVPKAPSPNDEYYCRELDGSYTLRTVNKIYQELQPGYWKRHSTTGWPYWIRTTAT